MYNVAKQNKVTLHAEALACLQKNYTKAQHVLLAMTKTTPNAGFLGVTKDGTLAFGHAWLQDATWITRL